MKTFFVAGGASGIGRQLVLDLLEKGHTVYASHHVSPTWSASNLMWQNIDFRSTDFITELPEKLDGLVYCPGNISLKPFHRFTDDEFQKDFELQVMGAIRLIRAALPALKSQRPVRSYYFLPSLYKWAFRFIPWYLYRKARWKDLHVLYPQSLHL
jgi:NAD(P)-dependent dehydrogenase (short-subunit alcohol dehydrogenase family)